MRIQWFAMTVALVAAVCSAQVALALDRAKSINQYGHDSWTPQSGLPGEAVYEILQTPDGYLWLRTSAGLIRFDGVRFVLVQPVIGSKQVEEPVKAICKNVDGNLLIRTTSRTILYKEGVFSDYLPAAPLPDGGIRNIFESRERKVFIGADDFVYVVENGQLKMLRRGTAWVNSYFQDEKGVVWVAASTGLYTFRNGVLSSPWNLGSQWNPDVVAGDREHNIWVGTLNGLFRMNSARSALEPVAQRVIQSEVFSVLEDQQGSLWVGTDSGLFRITGGRISSFDAPDGLTDSRILSLYEDREGSIWVGTSGGLDRFRDTKITTYTTKEGLSSNEIRSVIETRDGSLYVFCNGNGLARIRNGEVKTISAPKSVPDFYGHALFESKDGSLWIGILGGLTRYKDGKFTVYKASGRLSKPFISAINEDDESLIVTTAETVALRFKDGNVYPFTIRGQSTPLSKPGNYTFTIYRDPSGTLWFGTVLGLFKFAKGENPEKARQSQIDFPVTSIFDDQRGSLWLGGRTPGLIRFRVRDGRVTRYTQQAGLFDDYPTSILKDDRNNFWVSTSNGIYEARGEDLDAFADGRIATVPAAIYGTADGMKTSEATASSSQPGGWHSHDGKLWFATRKGVVMVDPNHLVRNDLVPPVVVEKVVASGESLSPRQTLVLPPGKNNLEFHYTSLSLLIPSRVNFKYELEGYDRGWVDAGPRRVAYYTNLPPGPYRFKVIASNNDGVWNLAGASVGLTLKPHFYQTAWFYALCILLVVFGSVGGQRLHTQALRVRALELSRVVAERTEKLEKEIVRREQSEKRTSAFSELKQRLLDSRGLNEKLESITDWIVEMFGADFARVWITRPADLCEKGCRHADVVDGPNVCTNRTRCLHLVASSGRYTRLDGEHRRVPLGCYKIGRVASGAVPAFMTNDVAHDPVVHNRDWARSLGLVSFAGYQLVSEQGEPVGVMALFRKWPLTQEEDTFLKVLAATTSQVVITGLSEEALRESEEKFKSLFENAVLGAYQTTPEGEILLANPALCRMFGYDSLGELRQSNMEQSGFHPSYAREAFRGEIEEKGFIVGLEAAWQRRDGTTIYVRESARAVRDSSGKVICYEGTVEDVTERKRAEENLRESRQLLKLVLDSIPVRVFWKDRTSQYLGSNRAFAIDGGLSSPDAITGKNDFELTWAEQAELYRADDRQVIESGKPKLNYEEPQTTPDGRKIWLRTSKVPLVDGSGQIRGVLGTYEDITERKRSEEALRKSEEKYRRYFEQNLAGYCVTTPEGRFLICNPAFLAMFGFRSMEEAAEVDVASVYPSRKDRDEFLGLLKAKKHVDLYEMELHRLDGTPIHIVQNAVGIFDEQDQLTEIHSYLLDDTKRWKIERQFMQAQKMEAVGRLTAGIAHDFNNMLAVINGFSDLLLEQIGAKDSRHRSVEQIRKAGERASALTRQLLAFSRQQVLEPKVTDLNEIVSGSASLISRVIGEDVKLNVVLSPSPCPVKVDMTQIEQVIMNLAVNARDAMPNGGQLTIETRRVTLDEEYAARHHPMTPGAYAMLTVSDTGTGMDTETRARIFEPFFTTKELGKGTGLGLATVYGIVRQSDGHIWVYSELGLGTTFKVYLPLFEKAAGAEEGEGSSPVTKSWTDTILVAEDDPSVREVIRQMLTEVGYTVLEAEGPEEARDIVESHKKPIALLLTDIVMPGSSGRLLADEVLALRSSMKILYMSGYTDDMVIRHGGLKPGMAFIQKPFSREALTKKIRELLDE